MVRASFSLQVDKVKGDERRRRCVSDAAIAGLRPV
jgi:hypothetical protein